MDTEALPVRPSADELLDALGHAVIATDARGTVLFWNGAAEQLYGWPAAEAVGRDITEVTVPAVSQPEKVRDISRVLEANPGQTPDITRRLREIREEFFEKRNNFIPIHRTRAEEKALAGLETEEVLDEETTAMTVYSEELREGEDATSATLASLKDDGFDSFDEMGEDERLSTIQRIARMTVSERVQTALKGNREERVILIRDANRLVASAVLDSPKLTDSEVEAIALMKNVSEEVLRVVGTKRDFAKNYTVIHNLVKNARTPIGTTLGLINRILTSDLRALARNKNIPEVLRKNAQRQVQIRTAPRDAR